MPTLHTDELEIDAALVRDLLRRSVPELATLPLSPLPAGGSTNTLFRLGEDLLVRLPRQPAGSTTIAKEARWLPQLAAGLPVQVPEVVAVGEPSPGYPALWSVVRWIDGDTPLPATSGGLADDLAVVVCALRACDVPPEALDDPALHSYRGDPLVTRDQQVRADIDACRRLPGLHLDLDLAVQAWRCAEQLPGYAEPVAPHWYHGDLLAENLLVRDDRLAAVLDFGGLAVGDPAVDLVVAWELLDAPARRRFRTLSGVDEATWWRGRAWALVIALMTFPYYWTTMPGRCQSRLVMARHALADVEEHGF